MTRLSTGGSPTANAVRLTIGEDIATSTDVSVTVRTVTNSTVSGTAPLSVVTTTDAVPSPAGYTLTIGPVSATASTVTAADGSVSVGGSTTVTVAMHDRYGNPEAGQKSPWPDRRAPTRPSHHRPQSPRRRARPPSR